MSKQLLYDYHTLQVHYETKETQLSLSSILWIEIVRNLQLEALERESPCRQTVCLGGRVPGLWVRYCDAETLHPLLSILPIFRLQYKRLVSREYLKRLGNVPRATRYLYWSNLVYIDAFAAALELNFN